MLRLTTLGGLALESDQGPVSGIVLRRRSLAFLSLVAGAGPPGISRDKVIAYLWPESDAWHARNSLKQILFALRHDLECDPVASATSVLRVDPRGIAVDRSEFEDALHREDFGVAVGRYRGPFLDGFYLEGLVEFERWIERERARLAHRYQAALQVLAAAAQAEGDSTGAVEWWQRLAEHDPFSSRIAVGLMQALVAVGDRVGALSYARGHERLLREELDTPPDTGERTFVQQLREHFTAGASILLGCLSSLPA